MTFTCNVTDGDRLYWEVDYANSSYSDVSRQRYLATDQPGREVSVTNNAGHRFNFTLTANSPLTSIATTTVSNQLSGTQVVCEDRASIQAASVIHVITRKVIAMNVYCIYLFQQESKNLGPVSIDSILMVGTVPHESMAVVHLNVLVSTTGEILEFSITITSPVESELSNFMTHNTTIQLSVLYNYEYTMNVVASNCAGNSTPVSTTFNISKHSIATKCYYMRRYNELLLV